MGPGGWWAEVREFVGWLKCTMAHGLTSALGIVTVLAMVLLCGVWKVRSKHGAFGVLAGGWVGGQTLERVKKCPGAGTE